MNQAQPFEPDSLGPPAAPPALVAADEPSPWLSRGYLPHFERAGLVQALTFRLHDSVPNEDAGTETTPARPPALVAADEPSPWRSRGYLPHFERAGLVQALTFRLDDSVPAHVIKSWKEDLARAGNTSEQEAKLRQRLARYEDQGHGAGWLRKSPIAGLVEGTLLRFDGERYRLIAWCIMPNHVLCRAAHKKCYGERPVMWSCRAKVRGVSATAVGHSA